jgi:hypothetical protein
MVLQRPGQATPVWRASFRATTSLRSIEDAIVRGLSRALGLPSAPGVPRGWPTTDAGHEAILAGDAYLRTTTRVGADSAILFYERALAAEPTSSVAAARLQAYVTTRAVVRSPVTRPPVGVSRQSPPTPLPGWTSGQYWRG